jgi:tripartite ATP-independent transporter DctM subunit
MDPILTVLLALGAVCLLVFLHVPIGVAMTLVGVIGFGLMTNFDAAMSLLAAEPASLLRNVDIGVVPLFLLMGGFARAGGLADDIYGFAEALIGHVRGGLAVATIFGCGLFGSIAGSSIATTATFGPLAMPQMTARRYKPSFAAGTMAVGGTLGTMVPPSVILVLYGLIAEQFILDLFIAAVIPAILAIAGYVIVIAIVSRLDPEAGPAADRASRHDLFKAAGRCRSTFLLFLCVSGGIYGGVFTVTEAASVGVLLTVAIAALRRRLDRKTLLATLAGSAANTAMIYVAIFGASILSYFIGLTRVSDELVQMLQGMNVPPLAVIGVLVLIYLFLGAIFDETAAMLVTLPFVLPVVTGLGFDPIWWGVVNLVVINLGMITPPIGMNVFVLNRITTGLSLPEIYRGVMPFIGVDLMRLTLLILVPQLSLWLVAVLKS